LSRLLHDSGIPCVRNLLESEDALTRAEVIEPLERPHVSRRGLTFKIRTALDEKTDGEVADNSNHELR
jgi:hypothetical protein